MSRPLKRRRAEGIRIRPHCLLAHVKVNGRQIAKSFPSNADLDEIQEWRARTRTELRKRLPDRGTLAADVANHLSILPDGRRKRDLTVWLSRWANALGKHPRSSITREHVVAQLRVWRRTYSGSGCNHAKQALLTLWRELDGPGHTCPALHIPRFEEGEPRSGFFEADMLAKVLSRPASRLPGRDLVRESQWLAQIGSLRIAMG